MALHYNEQLHADIKSLAHDIQAVQFPTLIQKVGGYSQMYTLLNNLDSYDESHANTWQVVKVLKQFCRDTSLSHLLKINQILWAKHLRDHAQPMERALGEREYYVLTD